MKITYFDLIDQSYYFPQEGFNIEDGNLYFNDTSIKYLIDKYQTPFKISFLPKIGDQIKKAKNLLARLLNKIIIRERTTIVIVQKVVILTL